MKFLSEYRDQQKIVSLITELKAKVSVDKVIMEVCGGQTRSLLRYGLLDLLPPQIKVLHGPGCPVCVTSELFIDQAIYLAGKPEIILCSFGDMLRVPGSHEDLLSARARGGDVRIVYSPFEALTIARENPGRRIVLFSVGFETTAPAIAFTIDQAQCENTTNFSVLISHVLVPPALKFIMEAKDNRVQGFLAAGHVCTIMGYEQYIDLAQKYHIPIVVTGFEPLDLIEGICYLSNMLDTRQVGVFNQYSRSVKKAGNQVAQSIMNKVFQIADIPWRGFGIIASSGLKLTQEYEQFNIENLYPEISSLPIYLTQCNAHLVLTGRMKPNECPFYGTKCTPQSPLGAPMVSSEGACAAYFQYSSPSSP